LKGCLPFFISTLMLSLYSQIDRIMIKQILNSTEMVGLYAASLNICTLITIVTDSICVSTRPLLMELKKGDSLKYQQRISQVLSVVIWISMIYSIVVAVFSKTVIQLLYGQAYYGAEASLKVVIWYTMFANIMNIRDLWLIDAKKSRYVTLFAVIGSVVDIIIN
jgi:PST family polysaccharide transporter